MLSGCCQQLSGQGYFKSTVFTCFIYTQDKASLQYGKQTNTMQRTKDRSTCLQVYALKHGIEHFEVYFWVTSLPGHDPNWKTEV